jgi:hypothetical protein
MLRPLLQPLLRPLLSSPLAVAMGLRFVFPGDRLMDESRNYLTDESGNKLTG